MTKIFTVGHSTRSIEEFISLLSHYEVKQLVDIRSVPRSRHVPQFEHTALEVSLPAAGIMYCHMKELGGLRPKAKESVSGAWRNASFRNYADYMQTEDFTSGLEELLALAEHAPTAIMCAEAVPWRCHRSLVGDALVVRGHEVFDIMNETTAKPHTLTSFAVVKGGRVTYPAEQTAGKEK